MESEPCKTCGKYGRDLIRECNNIVGLTDLPMGGYALKYRTVLACPKMHGFLGAFFHHHDRLEIFTND